eukprot:CAMPEP_0203839480 /NCGR_PEP_ID=MMETSP0359-20131031/202_1 /ASSEMBLY_ACC=CAM_ASM_000338 /TAXON_ID=268821 /ORGANISM="Scrippsiella Hangoei, Strain SHTV-5" /LENGTH=277 /DNA_ID=CAMNT_0050753525 /DNA_START=155 /DNA_END=989 /DNA_ORIENTATION=+
MRASTALDAIPLDLAMGTSSAHPTIRFHLPVWTSNARRAMPLQNTMRATDALCAVPLHLPMLARTQAYDTIPLQLSMWATIASPAILLQLTVWASFAKSADVLQFPMLALCALGTIAFNFPCGHARHSLQFSMTIPWGHRRRDLGALTSMSVLLWLVVEVDTLVLGTKSVSPTLAVVFELCKLTPSYPPFSSCLIALCVHWSRATLGNSLLANDTADPTALFNNCHCLPPRAEEISASALCSYCKIKACMCNKAGKELSKLWSSKIKHCKITALNLV